MEALPIRFCRAVRSYWPRMGYQELQKGNTSQTVSRTGRGYRVLRANRHRTLRLRRIGRIRTIVSSPIRLLARIRKTYMDSVVGILGKGSGLSIGSEALLDRRGARARPEKLEPSYFERRILLEVSHSRRASGEVDVAVKPRAGQSVPL